MAEQEPDYRFSLANERTLLAWVRTALGFVALGVPLAGGINGVVLPAGHRWIGLGAIALSVLLAPAAYRKWRRSQLAMRRSEELPRDLLPAVLVTGAALLAAVALVGVLFT